MRSRSQAAVVALEAVGDSKSASPSQLTSSWPHDAGQAERGVAAQRQTMDRKILARLDRNGCGSRWIDRHVGGCGGKPVAPIGTLVPGAAGADPGRRGEQGPLLKTLKSQLPWHPISPRETRARQGKEVSPFYGNGTEYAIGRRGQVQRDFLAGSRRNSTRETHARPPHGSSLTLGLLSSRQEKSAVWRVPTLLDGAPPPVQNHAKYPTPKVSESSFGQRRKS